MAVWMVRAGRAGENEEATLASGMVTIGWHAMPDLSSTDDRQSMAALYSRTYPDASAPNARHNVGHLWAFRALLEK